MRQSFTIPGKLSSLNEYINECRRNKFAGAEMKDSDQEIVEWAIRRTRVEPIQSRCRLLYEFFEPNMRRDLDNISGFAHKVIQDALVAEGILRNDGWEHISGYTDKFAVDNKNPRIVVTMIYKEA